MKHVFKTKLGNMIIEIRDFFVTSIDFTTQECTPFSSNASSLLKQARSQLREYMEGKRCAFKLPIKFQGTIFQKKVWNALMSIPYGQTWSYEDVAKKIQKPLAVRAVASAIGKNKIAIAIPCHRVIRKTGQIGEYAGGADLKKKLLKIETENS